MAYMKDADQLLSNIVGLENYSKEELIDIVKRWCQEQIDYAAIYVKIHNVFIVGSRMIGIAKLDDDLDVMLYYTGTVKAFDMYHLFNDEPLVIDDVRVEVKPIPMSEHYAAS